MSRGQVQIFSEFLGFSLGLIVVITIAFIFSTYFSPKLVSEALDYHLDNMIKQVEVAASQMLYYSEFFGDKTLHVFDAAAKRAKPEDLFAFIKTTSHAKKKTRARAQVKARLNKAKMLDFVLKQDEKTITSLME